MSLRRTRFTRALALSVAAAFALTACGGSSDEQEPSSSSSGGGSNTVTFWHTMTGVNAAALDSVVADFNSSVGKDKGVTVEAVFQGDDTMDKLRTLVQAGDNSNFPDVVMVPGPGVPSLRFMDAFIPVQDKLDDDVEDSLSQDDIEPNMVESVSYEDRMQTLPFNNSTLLLYYNKDAFKAAGLDPEAPPSTVAELADAAKALTIGSGDSRERWGLNVELRRYHMSSFIGGQGSGTYFGNNEGGRSGPMTEVTFGDDGTMSNFLAEWQKVVDSGGYKPVEDNANEEFATQATAMTLLSTARIATIRELVGDSFDWGVAPLPRVKESDTGGAAVGGNSLGLFDRKIDGNIDASWEFLQYAASPEVQVKWHIATGYIPVNVNVYDTPEITEHLKANPVYQVGIDQMHNSSPIVQEPFDIINWDVDAIIRDTMRQFAEGELDASAAENQMVTKLDEALASYARANL